MEVYTNQDNKVGTITSGSFSPTLKTSIAFASVPVNIEDNVMVKIRNQLVPAKVIKPPFVKKGQKNF